jgi:hypothetical protein
MMTAIQLIRKIIITIGQILQFVLWNLPVSMIALIGLYFAFRLFINPSEDTVGITNYAFAIVGALSSISFAYARTIEDKDAKQTIQYCGERFLHSALLFLVASIMKYFLLQEQLRPVLGKSALIIIVLSLVGFFQAFLYLGSLLNGIAALRELNTILHTRKKPGAELIKFF